MNTTNTATDGTKKAYQVTANVEGKSWLFRRTTLTADTESSAIEKAKFILMLTDEHKIEVEPVTVYRSKAKLTCSSYPYGRLRTTAYFSLEHKSGKGFRTVFQTVNPKNGTPNKPKNSAYYPVILPIEKCAGFFDYCGYCDFNGTEAINIGLYFMIDFYELFTAEELKSIAAYIYNMMKVNMQAQVIYCGSDAELLKPLYLEQMKAVVSIFKGVSLDFSKCLIDFEKIESLKVEGYQPFKTTTHATKF